MNEDGGDDVLLPSLSRTPRNDDTYALHTSGLGRENSLGGSRTRPVFTFGDGDGSDNEGDGSAESSSKARTPLEEVINTIDDERPPEGSKAVVKRYHALLELLSTEIGYLLDLRALVSVSPSPTITSRAHILNSMSTDISRTVAVIDCSNIDPVQTVPFCAFYF